MPNSVNVASRESISGSSSGERGESHTPSVTVRFATCKSIGDPQQYVDRVPPGKHRGLHGDDGLRYAGSIPGLIMRVYSRRFEADTLRSGACATLVSQTFQA